MMPCSTRQIALNILIAESLLAQSACAQKLGGGQSFEAPFGRLALGLIICTLIAVAVVLLLRHFKGGRSAAFRLLRQTDDLHETGRIKILEARRLSPHGDVCRFLSGDTEYLVVVSQGGATVIRQVQHPPSPQISAAPNEKT